MILFKPKRIMFQRGIDKAYAYLCNHGFTRHTAEILAGSKVSNLKIAHLGKICFLLNCTPNDLFEWEDDGTHKLPENHALNSLVREKTAQKSLNEMLKEIPIEKLPEIENLIKSLKDG